MSGRPWLSWEDALLRECFAGQRTDALAAVLNREEVIFDGAEPLRQA